MSAIPPATKHDQLRASNPDVSAFVSANAGSGKTYVLVQRIVRLLLADVAPGRILALTYTKAAAANMSNRVFEQLAGWVRLDDAALAKAIETLDGKEPPAARLAQARRLFAQAVETPGGLKIQTIHAFCERLLQMFPFEANVAARFEVLDDMTGAELLGEARDAVLRDAATKPGTRLAQALAIVAGTASHEDLTDLLRQTLALRALFRTEGPDGATTLGQELRRRLGLLPGDTREAVREAVLTGGIDPGAWLSIADWLGGGA